MAYKCPHCGEKLEYLGYSQMLRSYGNAVFDKELGGLKYEVSEYESTDKGYYYCPHCTKEITSKFNTAEAIAKELDNLR